MWYAALADTVVLLHFTFIVFACAGGLLAFRIHWIPWLHIPAALWGVAVELLDFYCPLTHLENWLRAAGGQDAYATSFIDRYIAVIVYPPGLTRTSQIVLGCALLLFNVSIYWLLWRRAKRQSRSVS